MAAQIYNLDRPQHSRNSSTETAIWRPLTEDTALPPSKPVATRDRLAERNQQRASVPRPFTSRVQAPQGRTTQQHARQVEDAKIRAEVGRAKEPRTEPPTQAAIPIQARALSPRAAQTVPSVRERALSPRVSDTLPPVTSPQARAISPRGPVTVPSTRLQQWRTVARVEESGQDTVVARESRSRKLSEGLHPRDATLSPTRQPLEQRSPKKLQKARPVETVALAPNSTSSPAPTELQQVNKPTPEGDLVDKTVGRILVSEMAITAASEDPDSQLDIHPAFRETREGGRSLKRDPERQETTEVSSPSAQNEKRLENNVHVPTSIHNAPVSDSKVDKVPRDQRSRPLSVLAPRAADARPMRARVASTSPASTAARTAMAPASPPLGSILSVASGPIEPEPPHRWEASHGWAFVNPQSPPASSGKPPPNFSRPLRSTASVPHLIRGSAEATPDAPALKQSTFAAVESSRASTEASGIPPSTGDVSTSGYSAPASTKALIKPLEKEPLLVQIPTSKREEPAPLDDQITSIAQSAQPTSPTLQRRGTHPSPHSKLLRPNSNSSGGSGGSGGSGSYGTMNASPEAAGRRKWQASTFDTSVLSEKELAKLKKKGINPALYLEMKAARKGKGLSPLVGNTYIG